MAKCEVIDLTLSDSDFDGDCVQGSGYREPVMEIKITSADKLQF